MRKEDMELATMIVNAKNVYEQVDMITAAFAAIREECAQPAPVEMASLKDVKGCPACNERRDRWIEAK